MCWGGAEVYSLAPVCPARTSANQLTPVWMLSHQRECPQVREMEQK